MSLKINHIIAGFTLLEQLGRGGQAVVWRARQNAASSDVALKLVLREDLGSDSDRVSLGRLQREFEVTHSSSRLQGVAEAIAWGERADGPDGKTYAWLARRYIHQPCLQDNQWLDRARRWATVVRTQPPLYRFCDERSLTIRARVAIMVDICRYVAACHREIIHRDLKPGNILVEDVNGTPSPVLIDFGTVVQAYGPSQGARLTNTGDVVGTPDYVAPELTDDAGGSAAADAKSDLYSLGIVLFELLSGVHPGCHRATSQSEDGFRLQPTMRHALLSVDATDRERIADLRACSVETLLESIDEPLEDIVLSALNEDRSQRARLDDVLQNLVQWLDGKPQSHPWSNEQRLYRRMTKRTREAWEEYSNIVRGANALLRVRDMHGAAYFYDQATDAWNRLSHVSAPRPWELGHLEAQALQMTRSFVDLAGHTVATPSTLVHATASGRVTCYNLKDGTPWVLDDVESGVDGLHSVGDKLVVVLRSSGEVCVVDVLFSHTICNSSLAAPIPDVEDRKSLSWHLDEQNHRLLAIGKHRHVPVLAISLDSGECSILRSRSPFTSRDPLSRHLLDGSRYSIHRTRFGLAVQSATCVRLFNIAQLKLTGKIPCRGAVANITDDLITLGWLGERIEAWEVGPQVKQRWVRDGLGDVKAVCPGSKWVVASALGCDHFALLDSNTGIDIAILSGVSNHPSVSAAGRCIVQGSGDGHILTWKVPEVTTPNMRLESISQWLPCRSGSFVAVHQDGEHVRVTDNDAVYVARAGRGCVWSIPLDGTLCGFIDDLTVIAHSERQVCAVDVVNGNVRGNYPINGGRVVSCGVAGSRVFAVSERSEDGRQSVHIWDGASGDLLHNFVSGCAHCKFKTLSKVGDSVVFFHNDPADKNEERALGDRKYKINLVNIGNGKQNSVATYTDPYYEVVVAGSGEWAAFSMSNYIGVVWLRGEAPFRWHQVGEHGITINGLAASPNGAMLALSGIGGPTQLLDVTSGHVLVTLAGVSGSCEWSPSGKLLAIEGIGATTIFDIPSGKRKCVLHDDGSGVHGVSWNPSESRILSHGLDGVARIWDSATGRLLYKLEVPGERLDVKFSPNGRKIIGHGIFKPDGRLHIWDSLAAWRQT